MTVLSPLEGASLWAPQYDLAPNPLTALEMRIAAPRVVELGPATLLDTACGTGRWMQWAAGRGITAFGVDASAEMLRAAAAKPGLAGRIAQCNLSQPALAVNAVDIAVCSFALCYLEDGPAALTSLAHVARFVLVSDLHPAAEAAGWKRSFRVGPETYEIAHFVHSEAALRQAGLRQCWRAEACFGEPERGIFLNAGRSAAFDSLRHTPAILCTMWERP